MSNLVFGMIKHINCGKKNALYKGKNMRKLFSLLNIIIFTIGGSSCESGDKHKQALFDKAMIPYKGTHLLRKMFVKEKEVTIKEPGKAHVSGGFFLFIGNVSGEYTEGTEKKFVTTNIKFAWDAGDNTFVISTIPLERIRIKLIEKNETPSVSFLSKEVYFSPYLMHDKLESIDSNEFFLQYLDYAVFTVNSEEWPTNINIPFNN